MIHEHSPEFHAAVINAALTGTPLTLPDCCMNDLIALMAEFIEDDLILSAEYLGGRMDRIRDCKIYGTVNNQRSTRDEHNSKG